MIGCFIMSNAKAEVFLATHILLNNLATKYLPDYLSTKWYGPYIGMSHGYRYEISVSYKAGSETEGSEKPCPALQIGYQFLQSASHKLSLNYARTFAKYQTENEVEGYDTIDSLGVHFNIGLLALKAGWLNHAFSESENRHDGGSYTCIGFDLYFGKSSFSMDLKDHYLEERKEHIAGGDIGLRYSFDNAN